MQLAFVTNPSRTTMTCRPSACSQSVTVPKQLVSHLRAQRTLRDVVREHLVCSPERTARREKADACH